MTDENNQYQLNTTNTQQNPALIYIASLDSPESRRTMRQALNVIVDIVAPDLKNTLDKEVAKERYQLISWAVIRFHHVQVIRASLVEKYQPATVNKILSALRGVLQATFNVGLMSAEDYQRAIQIKSVRGTVIPAGRDIDSDEIRALVAVCQQDAPPAGVRDAAMIAVLYTCGLRRAELVNLDYEDFDRQSTQLVIRGGKGRKQRTSYIAGKALNTLNAWLNVRGASKGALFRPVVKSGRIMERRMTAQAVYYILKKRAEQADVADFSPHDMRRTFVGNLLDNGADIATVAKLAGHADVNTTARYDRRAEETKRKAIELLDFPSDE